MQSIKELLEVSAYIPTAGYSLDLKKMVDAGIGRAEALQRWVALGRSEGSFYKAYKVFKDDLVRAAFDGRPYPGSEGRRIDVWEKYKVVKQTLVIGKRNAAVSLAIDLVSHAQKSGLAEVVVGLSNMLEEHFGSIELDARRYLRYRNIRQEYATILEAEMEVKSLKAKLVFSIGKKKDMAELATEIAALKAKTTGSPTFMSNRFTALSVWYELHGDINGLLAAFRETLAVYDKSEVQIPSSMLAGLYLQLTPILMSAERYAVAEAHISKALKSMPEGSQHWHLLMLHRASLGHVSGKPGIVRGALKMALSAPRAHNNPDIDHRWSLVAQLLEGLELPDVWRAVAGKVGKEVLEV